MLMSQAPNRLNLGCRPKKFSFHALLVISTQLSSALGVHEWQGLFPQNNPQARENAGPVMEKVRLIIDLLSAPEFEVRSSTPDWQLSPEREDRQRSPLS